MASLVAPLARVSAPVASARAPRRAGATRRPATVLLPRAAVPVPALASASSLASFGPPAAFASEVAQLADGSLDDAIPTIAVALSLGAILYSSAGALKGFAALLGGAEATASHILVKDESTAASLLERLRDGPQDNLEDRFAREAGKYSECPSKSKGGSLGTFKPGQMVKEFDGAVFNGPVGEIQGPVQTQFGYHLILVTDRKEPEEK